MPQPIDAFPRPSKTLEVLRWILVLPVAVVAYLGSQLLYTLSTYIFEPRYADWYLQIINTGIGSYCLVFLGAKVAPKQQFIVSIILATLNAAFIIGVTIIAAIVGTVSYAWWWLAITGAVGIAVSIGACWQIYEDHPTPLIPKESSNA